MTAFEEFGVLPEIAKAVEEMEWTLPTDVQAEAIPLILGGGDVLMAAETGSGKTGAFCLPILQIVWETLKDLADGKGNTSASHGTIPAWNMSMFDRDNLLAITPDGLRCQSRDPNAWQGCRATTGVRGAGNFYFEAIVTDEGLCRVGWSTQRAKLDLGTDRFGFGFGGTGRKSNDRNFELYGDPFGLHDVIGCQLDTVNMEISFYKNGIALGMAFPIPNALRNETFYPAVVLKNAEMAFNFGATPFKYAAPNGSVAVAQAADVHQHDNPLASLSAASGGDGANFTAKPNAPQAIIIEPSRELAEQTLNQITLFKKFLRDPVINELLLVGGMNVRDQMSALQKGVDIIVATPGRLEDLISGGQVSLTHCRFFVLDEADGLLALGHSNLINNLHRQIPKITTDGRRLQMVVCSATLHSMEVKKMAERLMHFPTWIDLKGEDSVPETLHHVVAIVDPLTDGTWKSLNKHIQTDGVHARDPIGPGRNTPETFSEAVKMLKGEYLIRAIDEHRMDRAILFCRTKIDCDNLERFLQQRDATRYSCVCLHGDRTPHERKANLDAFKAQRVKFLICTDVAARGLDISGMPFMVNFTMPDEKSNYVHRIGRVGRADRMGLAISLVSSVPEKVWYHGSWCASHGKNCTNTNLTDAKGCCIWLNEKNLLGEIEDYLTITIEQVSADMKVPQNQFDGKVVYGEKRKNTGSGYVDHVTQLVPIVKRLAELEASAQTAFLKRAYLL